MKKFFLKIKFLDFYKAILIAFFFSFNLSNTYSNTFDKCLWVKAEELTSDKKIENLISNAYRSDYKIIFLQIKVHEDYRYNPLVEKSKNSSIFDPLKSALFWANWYDLEIHIWMNVYKIWSSTWEPPENHIFYKLNKDHKDWFATDINGYVDCNVNFNSRYKKIINSNDFSGLFLSPLNKEVNDYTLNIIKKLLNDYSNLGKPLFNGIHLDYMRYKDSMYGYNYIGRKLFYDENKIDPIYLNKMSNHFSVESFDTLMNKWNNLKSDKITTLIKDVYNLLSKYDNLELSAAVKPNIYESKKRWNQDWDYWIRENYIDFVVIMNYFSDTESFSSNLWELYKYFEDRKNIDKIYVGINTIDSSLEGNRLKNTKLIKDQINNAIDFSFPAIAIFSSEYFKYNSSLYLDIFPE